MGSGALENWLKKQNPTGHQDVPHRGFIENILARRAQDQMSVIIDRRRHFWRRLLTS